MFGCRRSSWCRRVVGSRCFAGSGRCCNGGCRRSWHCTLFRLTSAEAGGACGLTAGAGRHLAGRLRCAAVNRANGDVVLLCSLHRTADCTASNSGRCHMRNAGGCRCGYSSCCAVFDRLTLIGDRVATGGCSCRCRRLLAAGHTRFICSGAQGSCLNMAGCTAGAGRNRAVSGRRARNCIAFL